MKRPALIICSLLAATLFLPAYASAQHEYAPITEKRIEYRNWDYKSIDGDSTVDLREFAAGKKLVLVFYFAPWCHSSRYQRPVTQELYEKYREKGFGVIAVSMYDSVKAARSWKKTGAVTFPIVVESTRLAERRRSTHFKYRWGTGDHRKWGTPWNIFLFPDRLEKKGEVLTRSAFLANGELRREEAEIFIRKSLGLEPSRAAADRIWASVFSEFSDFSDFSDLGQY